MRIAVSGTHCSGKSTLIEAFLLAHPDFAHESEPYLVLVEEYGENFSDEPSAEDFFRQLEFYVERLRQYPSGVRVIFDRSPLDFLAYMLALEDLWRPGRNSQLAETAKGLVSQAVKDLDLIVFVRSEDLDGVDVSDEEDLELRDAVDARLATIFSEDELGPGDAVVLEARGSTAKRLRSVEDAIKQ